jgi:hypothetical protein
MTEEGAHTLMVALSADPLEVESQVKLVRSVISKVDQAVMFVRPPAAE